MVNVDGSLVRHSIPFTYTYNFFLLIIWFDPIHPQDCIIADQSSALLACDLCGESAMIDERGGGGTTYC
jgi:hypothetical protein